ncbi:MAG: EMC3/TMCO1 family protein [Candidatus Verstraetearchaeota archaeon]|nr:EMC3/TMCO1 family protein [Candidatus Verstraetearchaeota archaeon]
MDLNEIYVAIVNAISAAMGPAKDYPWSVVTIFAITVLMAVISSGVTRAVVDIELVRRRTLELRAWQKEYTQALREKDEKALARIKKKEAAMRAAQAEMSKEQFKPLIFTMIPFFIFYYIFYAVFGFNQLTVAYSPIPLPFVGEKLNFWVWYLLSSFSISPLIQRVFNLPSAVD